MTLYLDYQATTPLALEVAAAMRPWSEDKFANPHSAHKLGRDAAATIAIAREQVAALLPPGGKLWFTSGATEALNWALRCAGSGGITLPDTEHAAVRDTALWLGSHGRPVSILPVSQDGLLDANVRLPDGTGMSATLRVNNEIGVIQPVSANTNPMLVLRLGDVYEAFEYVTGRYRELPEAMLVTGGTSASPESLNISSSAAADSEKVANATVVAARIPGKEWRKAEMAFMVGLSYR